VSRLDAKTYNSGSDAAASDWHAAIEKRNALVNNQTQP